jgi:predicted nuclease of restriction endonuclease-like (RecB) superfamily
MKNDPAVLATPEYRKFIEELKARVTAARISAARHVNRDLILLYWDIGRGIVEKQQILGWGESVVEMVSADLRRAFPQMIGFSPRNLRDMKRFYLAYTDEAIWRQPVAKLRQHTKWPQVVAKVGSETVIEILQKLIAEIPWGHNLLILNKLSDPAARLYYLRAAAQFGWSRNVLLNQIKARTYERAVTEAKTHNFPAVLPEYFAEQAEDTLKSSYCLEFLGIKREIKERELEDRLIEQLQNFIKTPPRHEGQIAIGQTTPRCCS